MTSKQSDFDAFCWRLDQAKRAIKQVKHKPRIVLLVDYWKAPGSDSKVNKPYLQGSQSCEF